MPVLLDSITDVTDDMQMAVAVSGSHGGLYPAAVASRAGLRAVVFNDAGIGLERAGVAGVELLACCDMAAVAVSCHSACIGSAQDAMENGIVSVANATAMKLGASTGMRLRQVLELLKQAPAPSGMLDALPESRSEQEVQAANAVASRKILCVDSASLIQPSDRHRVIITGSHGALIGGDPRRACKAEARAVAFNDAGFGKLNTGVTRLPALQQQGIAAVTLDCETCQIGSAASALATGVISACNQVAEQLGAKTGLSVKAWVMTL